MSADPVLMALDEELQGYAAPSAPRPPRQTRDYAGMVVPLELVTEAGVLAFFSTITVFGTPVDVTLSELALECFYPADAATAEILERAGRAPGDACHENAAQSRTRVGVGTNDPTSRHR